MGHLRYFVLATGALLLWLLLVACTATPTPTPTTAPPQPTPTATPPVAVTRFPLTLTDSSGGTVTIAKPPRRIVSLSPAQTETLFALGVGDLLVGRDRYSDFPEEAGAVPVVGDAFNLDLEKLTALRPDLVYLDFATPKADIERLGIPVLYLDPPGNLDGVLERILLMGRLVDRMSRAQALASDIGTQIEVVEARFLPGISQGPRVYYELDPGLFTVGPDTFIGDMLRRLKARNVAAEAQGPYPMLSGEYVIEKDPEVILLADSKEFGNGDETPLTVAARAGWGAIAAVRGGSVFPVNADLVSRPGPRIAQGLEHLAALLYAEQP